MPSCSATIIVLLTLLVCTTGTGWGTVGIGVSACAGRGGPPGCSSQIHGIGCQDCIAPGYSRFTVVADRSNHTDGNHHACVGNTVIKDHRSYGLRSQRNSYLTSQRSQPVSVELRAPSGVGPWVERRRARSRRPRRLPDRNKQRARIGYPNQFNMSGSNADPIAAIAQVMRDTLGEGKCSIPEFSGKDEEFEQWLKRLEVYEATSPDAVAAHNSGAKLLQKLKGPAFDLITSTVQPLHWDWQNIKKVLKGAYQQHRYLRVWDKMTTLWGCKRTGRPMAVWLREWEKALGEASAVGLKLDEEPAGILAMMSAELTIAQRGAILARMQNLTMASVPLAIVLGELKALGQAHELTAKTAPQERGVNFTSEEQWDAGDGEYLEEGDYAPPLEEWDESTVMYGGKSTKGGKSNKGKGKGRGGVSFAKGTAGGGAPDASRQSGTWDKSKPCPHCDRTGHEPSKCWKKFPDKAPGHRMVSTAHNSFLSFKEFVNETRTEAIGDTAADSELLSGERWADKFTRELRNQPKCYSQRCQQ